MTATTLLIILNLIFVPYRGVVNLHNSSGLKQADAYIELLKSPDKAKRQEAKANLLQHRQDAIPPLLSLLEYFLDHEFRILPDDEVERAKVMAQADLDSLVKNDVIELLGRLQAKEAIPLLMRSLEERGVGDLWEKPYLDMTALAAIGSAAVPPLIEEIKNAKEAAKRNSYHIDPYRIQIRAAMTLGDIGDARALPVLQELFRRHKDVLVKEAIKQIKEKNLIK